jgi:hypothetical protein
MTWLQGGPFLEISLITEDVEIKNLITKISRLKSISIIEENIEKKINQFETGYLFDEEDSNSRRMHTIRLNIFVEVLGKRKSLLFIERVAEKTLLLNFCFFGSEFDAPEWEQKGIQEGEYHHFVSFLSELLKYLKGIAGAVAIEKDILELISENNTRPDNVFSYKEINPTELLKQGEHNNYYIAVAIKLEEKILITSFKSNS